MPTDDSPRLINLARHRANTPIYSPTKVTRTYSRKPRTSSGSASQLIILDQDDHSPETCDHSNVSSSHTSRLLPNQEEEDQPASKVWAFLLFFCLATHCSCIRTTVWVTPRSSNSWWMLDRRLRYLINSGSRQSLICLTVRYGKVAVLSAQRRWRSYLYDMPGSR